MKGPLDRFPYERDARSRELRPGIKDGVYVFVQDKSGVIFVLPEVAHLHSKVLGGGQPAMYAGDLTVFHGSIQDITNLSGTFQFSDAAGLLAVAEAVKHLGFFIMPGAVRLFSYVDSSRPVVLR